MANELAGKYEGTVLICGSAPCLMADHAAAIAARSLPNVIALNDAASQIDADFIVTAHPEKAAGFRMDSFNPYAQVLSGQMIGEHDVDVWFTDCNSGGTSAGMAIKIAKVMGFREIILCGCPMTGGDGYFDAKPKPNPFGMTIRIGDAKANSSVVKRHQNHLVTESQKSDYSMVKSMSGWTAELFGRPGFASERAA